MTGVLIDDLITQKHNEPYRMFTSRSEFRLLNRAENSDFRLTPKAMELGIIQEDQREAFMKKKEMRDRSMAYIKNFSLTSNQWLDKGVQAAKG